MRAVWSFWSRPYQAHKGFMWCQPIHHLLAWGLSVGAARQHYPETVLVTDRQGKRLLVDVLGLPFTEVSTELERLDHVDPAWWALGKLVTYSIQDRPFIHIDTDVFLWKPLPSHVEKSPVFGQYPESHYQNHSCRAAIEIEAAFSRENRNLPVEWEWARSRWETYVNEENCGIVGGTNVEFLRYYATKAVDLVLDEANGRAWSQLPEKSGYNYVIEQFLLAACLEFHRFHPSSPYRGVRIKHLFASWNEAFNPNQAARLGYTHLHGSAKSSAAVGRRLEERVRRDDPAFYRRCKEVLPFAEAFCEVRPPAVSREALERRLAGPPPVGLPDGWARRPEVEIAYSRLADKAIAKSRPHQVSRSVDRGIIICGGGAYFACAWVCIKMLRHLGCTLPIQLWHLGEREVDGRMRRLLAKSGVECADAEILRTAHPARILNGWELKAYALVHSPFREAMLLDADNVPVRNPTYLFDAAEFRDTGAVFWPDRDRVTPDRSIWRICALPYFDEPGVESGQILVDTRACWKALRLALHYNEHSDFYYQHIHGDKETFRLAFRRLGFSYAMPSRPIHALDSCMCQHDFEGRRVFQHRNLDKWRLDGSNRPIAGFLRENLCRQFLAELRERWTGLSGTTLYRTISKRN